MFLRAEQYMMTKNARLFEDDQAVALIIMSPDPSTHKRIGRGVRNFDSALWDREKQNVMLPGTYTKLMPNPALKKHLSSTGSKRFAEASPLHPVWGVGLWADDPKANDPC